MSASDGSIVKDTGEAGVTQWGEVAKPHTGRVGSTVI